MATTEQERLAEIRDDATSWRRWGPYVSDRAWGTVREDYSADGNAWAYLPFDRAAAKAYRWGEDGIAGISDRYQLLAFAPAFWNQRDAILKERLFGVVPSQGNHGEDVKEYYYYLDNTPTHSYMKFLYKYPQAAFPYEALVAENQRRQGNGPEFELLDTGIFRENRYFDIFVEYAKASPEEIVARIEAVNRGPDAAALDILPHLWFRNIWAWGPESWGRAEYPEPAIRPGPQGSDFISLLSDDSKMEELTNVPVRYRLGGGVLYGPRGGTMLFTDNETNGRRGLRRRESEPQAALQRRLSALADPRRRLHQPRADRHEGGDPLPFPAGAAGRVGGVAISALGRCGGRGAAGRGRQPDRDPPGRGRRLLRRHPPATGR